MAVTSRRKPAAQSCGHEDLAAQLAETQRQLTAVARLAARLAVNTPGGTSPIDRILTDEFRLSREDAAAVIAAATGGPGT